VAPLLAVNQVSKVFAHATPGVDSQIVLDGVSLDVGEGEIVALIGPSGCGKTTLLRIIAGLIDPDAGECTLAGARIDGPSNDIGMVFQLFSLLPWRTAAQNLEFPLELRKLSKDERKRRSNHYLQLVGLEAFANHRPYQLSGGMQQRVGLARALAVEPRLLLMDEPFGSLDQQTAERLRDELLRIQAEVGTATVIVTHNIDEALYLGNRVVVLGGHPSSVVREIAVDLPERRWEKNVYAEPTFALLREELRSMLLPDAEPALVAGGRR
jgi:NitT/TauT family transport system ATP-binding protein